MSDKTAEAIPLLCSFRRRYFDLSTPTNKDEGNFSDKHVVRAPIPQPKSRMLEAPGLILSITASNLRVRLGLERSLAIPLSLDDICAIIDVPGKEKSSVTVASKDLSFVTVFPQTFPCDSPCACSSGYRKPIFPRVYPSLILQLQECVDDVTW